MNRTLPILYGLLALASCRPNPATVTQARYLMGTIVSVTASSSDSLRCARAVNRAFDAIKEGGPVDESLPPGQPPL